jgi:hypothetical protein
MRVESRPSLKKIKTKEEDRDCGEEKKYWGQPDFLYIDL